MEHGKSCPARLPQSSGQKCPFAEPTPAVGSVQEAGWNQRATSGGERPAPTAAFALTSIVNSDSPVATHFLNPSPKWGSGASGLAMSLKALDRRRFAKQNQRLQHESRVEPRRVRVFDVRRSIASNSQRARMKRYMCAVLQSASVRSASSATAHFQSATAVTHAPSTRRQIATQQRKRAWSGPGMPLRKS